MSLDAFVPWKCPACPKINKAPDRYEDSHLEGWRLVTECPGCKITAELVRLSTGELAVTLLREARKGK